MHRSAARWWREISGRQVNVPLPRNDALQRSLQFTVLPFRVEIRVSEPAGLPAATIGQRVRPGRRVQCGANYPKVPPGMGCTPIPLGMPFGQATRCTHHPRPAVDWDRHPAHQGKPFDVSTLFAERVLEPAEVGQVHIVVEVKVGGGARRRDASARAGQAALEFGVIHQIHPAIRVYISVRRNDGHQVVGIIDATINC